MFFSIALLIVVVFLAFKAAPVEKKDHALIHGAGQVGLLAALALFGVDYFTSYFYATGEMMSALHPYNLQKYAFIAVAIIALANAVFGFLYMYSLGVFREGGGSFAAAMRYLGPALSLVVAVVLIQDYVFTIVVSTLSGVEQLLSLRNAMGIPWYWHFMIGAVLVLSTWYLTIRGRGESARVVFMMLGVFILLTIVMAIGLFLAKGHAVAALPYQPSHSTPSLLTAAYHMLTASMKGLVALSGLEAMSDGIQFVIDEDTRLVKWGKQHLPRLNGLWNFYSGKSGIGRFVQTAFLFYGGITTAFLAYFSLHFNAFNGIQGRSLVGNLSFIGFGQIPGGTILYWAYQILAVALLASASMTAYQDLQAMAWRNVAIGEIPEVVVYRNPKGTFTRPVTAAAIAAIVIQLIVRGNVSLAVPYYGVGVFLPIMAMGLAIRQHIRKTATGRQRMWGSLGASTAASLAGLIFIGQIVGKWTEGGWVVLISLGLLVLMAHAILISPIGYRTPKDIHRIIREKSRIQGQMGNIVEWQSLTVQEYRYRLLGTIAKFWELFGVRRPIRFEPPIAAGDFSLVMEHNSSGTYLENRINGKKPRKTRPAGKLKGASPATKTKKRNNQDKNQG
jgi:amino acid transporter